MSGVQSCRNLYHHNSLHLKVHPGLVAAIPKVLRPIGTEFCCSGIERGAEQSTERQTRLQKNPRSRE